MLHYTNSQRSAILEANIAKHLGGKVHVTKH